MIAISSELVRSARVKVPESSKDRNALVEKMLSTSPDELSAADAKLIDSTADGAPEYDGAIPVEAAGKAPPRAPKADDPREKPTPFAKVPVEFKKVASSLSKELVTAGSLRNGYQTHDFTRQGAVGPVLKLEVFSSPGLPPLKMKIQGTNTVEDVIDLIIRHHTELKRKPALNPDSDNYDLRMVDDDDGTPDMDLPPLERNRDIHKINVTTVALVPKDASSSPPSRDTARPTRGKSIEPSSQLRIPGKTIIKVHMPNQYHTTLAVADESTVAELLPLLAKKRPANSDPLTQQLYKFVTLDGNDTVEMDTKVCDIPSQELKLVLRAAEAELKTVPEISSSAFSTFVFTTETANLYESYRVVKTNERGKKQERLMGIDGEGIYNRTATGTAQQDGGVQRQFRKIKDVQSISPVPNSPRAFVITYKNGDVREFEAETVTECGRIIAKVRFLITNAR